MLSSHPFLLQDMHPNADALRPAVDALPRWEAAEVAHLHALLWVAAVVAVVAPLLHLAEDVETQVAD